jgi:hypothetical protein
MSFPKLYRENMKDRLHNIASMLGTSLADQVTRLAAITMNDALRINTTYLIKSQEDVGSVLIDIRDTIHATIQFVQAMPRQDLYTAIFVRNPQEQYRDMLLAMEISNGRKLEMAAWLGLVTAGTEEEPIVCFGLEKPADHDWLLKEYDLTNLLKG